MTERLSQLLHDEARDLVAPRPDTWRIIAEGRRLRRRRQVTTGLAAAVAVIVGAVGVTALLSVDPPAPDPATIPADAVVYGWQDQVHVGDVSVTVPGNVTDVDRTASGVLVTSENPDTLTLVRPDGSTVNLGPTPEESSVATDPEADVYVHTRERDGELVLVVRDLDTGDVERELPLLGPLGRSAARAGISLDDGTAYVGVDRRGIFTVDLATGVVRPLGFATSGLPAVRAGRAVVGEGDSLRVVDVATGDVVLTVPTTRLVNASLSPDARRFLTVHDTRGTGGAPLAEESPPEVRVYDVDSGEKVVLDTADAGIAWAWTLAGDLYRIDGEDVVRCDPATGSCDRTPAPDPVPAYGDPAIPGTPSW